MHSSLQPQDVIYHLTDHPESLVKNISDNFISQNKHVNNLEDNIYGAFYPLTCTFELNTNPKIFLKENDHILFHIEHEQESPENSIWDMKTAPHNCTNAIIDSYLIDIVDKVGEAMDKFRSKDLRPAAPGSYYSHSIGSILRAPQAKQPVTTPTNYFPQTAEKENSLENNASAVREAVDRFNSKPLNPVAPTSYYSKSIGSIRRTPQSKQLIPAPANLPPTAEKEKSTENKVNAVGEAVNRFNSKPLNPPVAPTSYYSKSIGSILRAPQARPSVPIPPNFPKTTEKENPLENKVNAVGGDVKRLNSRPLNPVEPTSYYAASLLPDMPRAPRPAQPLATTTANFPRAEEKKSSFVPKFEVFDEDRLYENSPAVALPHAASEREDTILKRLEALEKSARESAIREDALLKRITTLESVVQESAIREATHLERIAALELQLKSQQKTQNTTAPRLFKS